MTRFLAILSLSATLAGCAAPCPDAECLARRQMAAAFFQGAGANMQAMLLQQQTARQQAAWQQLQLNEARFQNSLIQQQMPPLRYEP